jgi:hypothetical protein
MALLNLPAKLVRRHTIQSALASGAGSADNHAADVERHEDADGLGEAAICAVVCMAPVACRWRWGRASGRGRLGMALASWEVMVV